VTTDLGATWSQFATFPETRLDLPKLSIPSSRWVLRRKVLYQAVRVGTDPATGLSIDHLVRVSKSLFFPGAATVHYPAMTGFGGLGINPTMFAWYEVFGVNPDNPNHLIAPDVINQRVMQSRDGGETWTEITQLTSLVTDSGRLRFRNGIFPVLTAVSFCPDNPLLVLVGTAEGGIFVSQDGGTTWSKVAGSGRIPLVSSIHWRTANDVVVSSYGRGLWRLQNRIFIHIPDLENWCRVPCQIWRFPFPRPDPLPYDRGILVFDGVVQGARFENGFAREIFVSPGSSLVHAVSRQAGGVPVRSATEGVKVTESAKWVGFTGVEKAPVTPQTGWIIKGLLFDAEDRPLGAIFGDQPADMHFAAPPALVNDRPNRSPTADKPYARLYAPRSDGGPTASPGERVRVTGERFPGGTDLVLTVGGQVVSEKITVTPTGTFDVAIPAPAVRGFQQVEIRRNTAQRELLDAVTVLVKHADKPAENDAGGRGTRPGDPSGTGMTDCVAPARPVGRFGIREAGPRPILGRLFRGWRGTS
jgi:hypothetical protein